MPVTPSPLNLAVTYGDSGLKAWGGFLTEEFLPELQGAKGRAAFRRMANNDATIGAMLVGIKALITGADWTLQAADDSDAAVEAKKWLQTAIDDMETPIEDVKSEAVSMFEYGFAPMEVTYGTDNRGRIVPKDIALRSQTSLINWEIDGKDGTLLGMNQMGTWKGSVMIPRKKIALFRTESNKQNPEGKSLLRNAYRSWYFKSKLEEIEAVGAERNNAGLPVIRIPARYLDPSAIPEEKAFVTAMTAVGQRIRRDQQECIVVASDLDDKGNRLIDISLLTPGGKTLDIGAIVQRYDQAMARSVLMDFIFLGAGSVGSFALSSDKTSLFAQSLGAFTKRMAQTFTRDVIAVMWKANQLDPAVMPKMTVGDLEKPDLGQLTQAVSTLFSFGGMIDRETENAYRKAVGLPLAPEEGLGDQGAPGMQAAQGAQAAPNRPGFVNEDVPTREE